MVAVGDRELFPDLLRGVGLNPRLAVLRGDWGVLQRRGGPREPFGGTISGLAADKQRHSNCMSSPHGFLEA